MTALEGAPLSIEEIMSQMLNDEGLGSDFKKEPTEL